MLKIVTPSNSFFMRPLILSSAFGFLFLSSPIAQGQSLNVALQGLLSNNNTINAAFETVQSAHDTLASTRTRLYPKITLNTSVSRTTKDNSTVRSVDIGNGVSKFVRDSSITATQELFSGYSDLARIEEAEANLHRSQALLISSKQKEISNGAVAYFTILQEVALIEALQKSLELAQKTLEITEDANRSGADSLDNVIVAQKDVASQKSLLVAQKHRLARAKGNFVRYFGVTPEPANLQFTSISTANIPTSWDDFLSQIQNSSEIKASNLQVNISRAKTKRTKSAQYPKLSLNIEHSRDNGTFIANDARDGIDLSDSEETILELTLKWEISALLYNDSAESSAKYNEMSNLSKAHALMSRLEGQALNLWDDYFHYQEEIAFINDIRVHEMELEKLEDEKIAAGGSKIANKIKLQSRHIRTEQRLIRATHALEQTKIKILALTNKLSADI